MEKTQGKMGFDVYMLLGVVITTDQAESPGLIPELSCFG